MFEHAYWSAQYFAPVWFAPGDESHLTPEELSQAFGGGGPDSSDAGVSRYKHDDRQDDAEYLPPSVAAHVKRINAERSAAVVQADMGNPISESRSEEIPEVAADPEASARVSALVSPDAERDPMATEQAEQHDEDEAAALLAAVIALTDD